jgi:transglutaminase-like putative cysteine protease
VATQTQLRQAAPEIERLFQFSLLLLIVTGFVTLVLTGKLDLISTLCVSAALIFRAYDLILERNFHIPQRWTSFLGIVYVAFYLADFFLISQNFVSATVHLVLFGMMIKIFSVQRERDHVYLATLAFLEVLSAAILTVDSVFLGAFITFSLVSVVTFIAMEMRRSSAAATNSAPLPIAAARNRRTSSFSVFGFAISRMALFIVLGMLASASIIFFTLPRLSYGYLSKFAQQNSLVSGFSDNVNLGEIGRIQQSSQLVAHVKIDNDDNGLFGTRIYLRGTALTRFDGLRWLNPPRQTEVMPNLYGGRFAIAGRSSQLSPIVERFAFGSIHSIIKYRVQMEPIGTNVVFLVSQPRYLLGKFKEISVDLDESVLNVDRDHIVADYTGISDLSQPVAAELSKNTDPVPAELATRYLQLPELDSRVVKLTHSLTDRYHSPVEKAEALQHHLVANYGYTLQLPSETPADPLADFLFHRKEGHCEYFASAMAVMLREAGIPSRIVTGFRGGEFNKLTASYIVRASDAHAWVEAYIPGAGWVTFDPTPAGNPPVMTSWRRFEMYMDAAREFWREWIINYDVLRQQQLTQKTVTTTRDRFRELRDWGVTRYQHLLDLARLANRRATERPRRTTLIVVLALAGIVLLFNIGRFIRALRRRAVARNPRSAPNSAASIWYHRMERAAAREGYRREPAQTPAEFASRIDDDELRLVMERFNAHYEQARFNDSAEDAEQLPRIFEEFVTRK